MKTHLDLFSGIGGFALAASWAGFKTIGFCENEDFPRRLLSVRFPGVPIHGDIRELNGEEYRGVTLITGGFPCQPFSVAGKQAGKADDRYLWPEMLRIIAQAQPDWVVAENVTGIVTLALDQVLSDLEGEGYSCGTVVLPACAVDAPHRRDRVWIIAKSLADAGHSRVHKYGQLRNALEESGHIRGNERDGLSRQPQAQGGALANPNPNPAQGMESWAQSGGEQRPAGLHNRAGSTPSPDWWEVEPPVGRVVNGVSRRMDRLKGLGNAIVPQVAYEILRLLIEK